MDLHGLALPDARPGEGPAAWIPEAAWGASGGQGAAACHSLAVAGRLRLPVAKLGAWQSMGPKQVKSTMKI